MTPDYRLPDGLWRLWKPSAVSNVSAANPCGFHAPIVEKGWNAVFRDGLGWGEPPVDSLLERFHLCVMWAHGEWGPTDQPPVSGYYPADVGSTAWRCRPRGPQDLSLAEASVSGFWTAMAPRIARAHAAGRRVMVYYGTPPLSLFAQNTTVARRNALLDALINPALGAGMGPDDLIACDASAATTQKSSRTDGMYFAERVLARGIGFCCESHEQVHPELYPWFNGRFSCLSLRSKDPKQSRWDVALGKGWFGPGMPWAIKENFCLIQGSEKVEDRPSLIVQGEVNGSPCHTIMEMNDVPPAWLEGVAA